ncbi:stage II sporulation protein M [Clostridium estertheticum]|uniref:stage II sporulation protein M n=1 Tax=Clostridium estertheticum TaxID=238834 RepID=UPI001C0D10CE|nr:stage II sporulation protein M [Clostridium estertheticum]MBU3074518.1 stage II sporulation protein M [Clostridium estertheticum]MBU3165982.1 stage II sporulation protein M [Clostridium estertheticum]
MKEEQFIKINSDTWRELEDFSIIINKKGVKKLPSEDVVKFLQIFRSCSHNLAYATTHYPKSKVVSYLNSLVSKCHNHVYAVKKISPSSLIKYITYDFPLLLKKYKWFIISSFSFFALGVILSMILVLINVNNASMFLPSDLISTIKSGNSGPKQWNSPLMSSNIMVNNISVSLKAFVMGITLGIGTIYVLFFNGALMGALTVLEYTYGNPINYWSLILPHGIIELTAIFISGAAGLMIAKSMLLPGEYSRKHALIKGAKESISLIIGVTFMLIIAGIIEGFFTPLNISESSKLIFAGVSAILLTVYFSIPYLIKK